MPFIGNQPALSYTSFAKQDFTTSATTSYTLDNPVANENEIALFINFVRQEPTTAYTASGTTLTLTSATSASDDMYCVFLGKAVQTVNPPNGSVGTAQLADNGVTTAKILDANITSAKLASGVLPDNTPAFFVKMDATQTVATNTWTKLELDAETYDTDNAFASYKFTVPSGEDGKYLFTYAAGTDSLSSSTLGAVALYKNGSFVYESFARSYPNSTTGAYPNKACILNLAATDYIELYGQHTKGSNADFNLNYTFLAGHKLIG
jgi:hypothetical protein